MTESGILRSADQAYPAGALADVRRPSFTSFLDLSRWIAAAIVFLGHLRNPLFMGRGHVAHNDRNLAVTIWYFVTGWYAEAVIVFFVLSGYLVGGLSLAKLKTDRFSYSSYMIERVTRIYVAFFPALLLTVVLDHIGSTRLGAAGLYDASQAMLHQKMAGASYLQYMSPKIFGFNVVLLQTFFSPAYGTDQPLWTISAEFWFYVVFGLTVSAAAQSTLTFKIIVLGAASFITFALGGYFVALLGLWLIGILVALAPAGRHERPWIALFFFFIVLSLARIKQDTFEANDIARAIKNVAVALAFCWLLLSMRRVQAPFLLRLAPLNKRLADFSFSLYLVHFPVAIFVLSGLYATGAFPGIATGYAPTDPVGLTIYVLIVAFVFALAWIFSRLTEKQTPKIRRMVRGRLSDWQTARRPLSG